MSTSSKAINFRRKVLINHIQRPVMHRNPLRPFHTSRLMQLVEWDYFGPIKPSPGSGARYVVYYEKRHVIHIEIDMFCLVEIILLKTLGSSERHSRPYHPQTTGFIERRVQIVKRQVLYLIITTILCTYLNHTF